MAWLPGWLGWLIGWLPLVGWTMVCWHEVGAPFDVPRASVREKPEDQGRNRTSDGKKPVKSHVHAMGARQIGFM